MGVPVLSEKAEDLHCMHVFFLLCTESESLQAPNDLAAATKESNMEVVEQGVVEQSVVTLMGEIGKHIEGQFQGVEGADNSVPVTVMLEDGEEEEEEDEDKG